MFYTCVQFCSLLPLSAKNPLYLMIQILWSSWFLSALIWRDTFFWCFPKKFCSTSPPDLWLLVFVGHIRNVYICVRACQWKTLFIDNQKYIFWPKYQKYMMCIPGWVNIDMLHETILVHPTRRQNFAYDVVSDSVHKAGPLCKQNSDAS